MESSIEIGTETGKKWKKYWGVAPIAIFLLLKILIGIFGGLTDSVLRSIPQMLLSWFGAVSVYILVFWLGRILLWKKMEQDSLHILIFRKVLSILYIVIVVVTMGIGMFISVFKYRPEHIEERSTYGSQCEQLSPGDGLLL